MLQTNTLFDGIVDLVQISIDRLRSLEPPEGYYGAFSGGKDSCTVKKLCELAGVKVDWHYNLTTVDPPELVQFIREYHPDVQIHKPAMSMWQLIPEKRMPPTRVVRYCCQVLKEGGGEGRRVLTGVRWAESDKRKKNRGVIETDRTKTKRVIHKNDNEEARRLVEACPTKGMHVINVIIDWADADVWEFIQRHAVPVCKLYKKGWKRLGCIACSMAGKKGMERDFRQWPKFKAAYLRAFGKMLKVRRELGLPTEWETAEEVMHWWINNPRVDPNQLLLLE